MTRLFKRVPPLSLPLSPRGGTKFPLRCKGFSDVPPCPPLNGIEGSRAVLLHGPLLGTVGGALRVLHSKSGGQAGTRVKIPKSCCSKNTYRVPPFRAGQGQNGLLAGDTRPRSLPDRWGHGHPAACGDWQATGHTHHSHHHHQSQRWPQAGATATTREGHRDQCPHGPAVHIEPLVTPQAMEVKQWSRLTNRFGPLVVSIRHLAIVMLAVCSQAAHTLATISRLPCVRRA
jgi:hypothetical protein